MNDHATDFSAEATEQHLQLAEGFYFAEDCVPSKDEPYMNPRQLKYFRGKLLDWREKLLKHKSGANVGGGERLGGIWPMPDFKRDNFHHEKNLREVSRDEHKTIE